MSERVWRDKRSGDRFVVQRVDRQWDTAFGVREVDGNGDFQPHSARLPFLRLLYEETDEPTPGGAEGVPPRKEKGISPKPSSGGGCRSWKGTHAMSEISQEAIEAGRTGVSKAMRNRPAKEGTGQRMARYGTAAVEEAFPIIRRDVAREIAAALRERETHDYRDDPDMLMPEADWIEREFGSLSPSTAGEAHE